MASDKRSWPKVAIFREEDGEAWAKFLSEKLESDSYNIPSEQHALPVTPQTAGPFRSRKGSRSHRDGLSKPARKISTGTQPDIQESGALGRVRKISTGSQPDLSEGGPLGRARKISTGNPADARESTLQEPYRKISTGARVDGAPRVRKISRGDPRDSGLADLGRPGSGENPEEEPTTAVMVVLISPKVVESANFSSWNLALLDPEITLLILLGVGTEDLYRSAGDDKSIQNFEVLLAEQNADSVKKILSEIIRIYERNDDWLLDDEEDDDDAYEYPPSSLLVNRVHAVLPRKVKRGGEVFLVMDKPSESDLLFHLQSHNPGYEVELGAKASGKALYCLTLPDHVLGELDVNVKCGSHSYGRGHIEVGPPSQTLCPEEADSLSLSQLLLTLAVGVGLRDREAVDARLARQLKEQMPPQSLQLLQILGNATSHSDKSTRYEWPTLLHFAASEGLEAFTTELLRYPCMLEAALSENRHGDTPFDLASRRGHPRIAQIIEDFVLKQSKDSGIIGDVPPPSPHRSGHDYYNQQADVGGDDYVDMSSAHSGDKESDYVLEEGGDGKTVIRSISDEAPKEPKPSNIPFMNEPLDGTERNTKLTPSSPPAATAAPDLGSDSAPVQLPPKMGRRTGVTDRPFGPLSPRERRPSLTSGQEPMSPISETHALAPSFGERAVDVPDPSDQGGLTGMTPALLASLRATAQVAKEATPDQDDTMTPEEEAMMRYRTKRSKSMQERVASFFHKLGRRRTRTSEADHSPSDKSGKRRTTFFLDDPSIGLNIGPKAVFYVKSGGKRPTQDPNMERDSGSYSDEEGGNGSKTSSHGKKKGHKKDRKLCRKQSVRLSRVLRESGHDAPSVPAHHA